ncbi:hypothetical protein FD47_GL002473 [Lentilactobacillus parafarraginis DSM 18390 = JCM 14109]|jgi:hypothetical protein|uniref:Uncharacterized protein n=1 Tax=Lentilactobacillus parafarraginis DSM 18390 = JCM 14109 TaxID=1423786 RepID=A0A0R1YNI8_9LACO|nr:hypothetical protein FD47_GL002473 [Lentilactobacillus parafarraginis DSM 18390 = JCM 14109]
MLKEGFGLTWVANPSCVDEVFPIITSPLYKSFYIQFDNDTTDMVDYLRGRLLDGTVNSP